MTRLETIGQQSLCLASHGQLLLAEGLRPFFTFRTQDTVVDQLRDLTAGESAGTSDFIQSEWRRRWSKQLLGRWSRRSRHHVLFPSLPHCQLRLDDLEGQEMIALLLQYETQPLDVVLEKLPVPRGAAMRVDQSLALQEPDF